MQSYSIWKARSQNDYSKEDNSVVPKNCKTYQNIHSEHVRGEMLKHPDFE